MKLLVPSLSTSCLVVVLILLSACSESDGLDGELFSYLESNGLDQAFEVDHEVTNTDLKELGGDLFYSPDLSVFGSISCASCHHPKTGGADGLNLPIGVGGGKSLDIGDQRLKASINQFGGHGLMGLIPRNSPTVINASLYKQNLFWDGRVQRAIDSTGRESIKVGFGISSLNPAAYQQKSLLQAQARLPLSSPFEMKGISPSYENDQEIEYRVISQLRDVDYWCKRFESVFSLGACDQNISLDNLTLALAEYQASLVLTNSPFQRYIEGDKESLSEDQKKGALLFYKSKSEGGLGCVGCHSGKILSDEKFYDLAIPGSGIGANDDGLDYGRNNVDKNEKLKSFKVPSLLNISETAPYFHNGSAETLNDAVLMHILDSRQLAKLKLIKLDGVEYDLPRDRQEKAFRSNKQLLEKMPQKITQEELTQVLSFMESLSDKCFSDEVCVNALIREEKSFFDHKILAPQSADVMNLVASKQPAISPKMSCNNKPKSNKEGAFSFSPLGDIGLDESRELGVVRRGSWFDAVNYAGASVVDVNYDCLDDMVLDLGVKGIKLYLQQADGSFDESPLFFSQTSDQLFPMVLDLDGDYRFDLIVGSLGSKSAYVVNDFMGEKSKRQDLEGVSGPVINASSADIDGDGDIDLSFAFWRTFKSLGQPHIWMNEGDGVFRAQKNKLSIRSYDSVKFVGEGVKLRNYDIPLGKQDLTFTPNFTDIDNDGDVDLLLAADFHRSQIFENRDGILTDITDPEVVSDSNGMGAAVGDFNNDGYQDWFVTSIFDQKQQRLNGHRIYWNTGKNNQFTSEVINPGEDEWSWGACAADFNNDGFLDIFYISGFGEEVKSAVFETDFQQSLVGSYFEGFKTFAKPRPKLLLNNQKGGFEEVGADIGLDSVLAGRGIACFDHQQDGDIDILVMPLEGEPRLLQNQLNGKENWIQIKLLGLPGNTEAFGVSVVLQVQGEKQYRQVRLENNYISRNPATLHFGLGDNDSIDELMVKLPNYGRVMRIKSPSINQLHVIRLEAQ